MGYENSTFPLDMYECALVFWYHIRINKRSETTIMATMQAFLSNKRTNIVTSDEACSTVIYRPSTSN